MSTETQNYIILAGTGIILTVLAIQIIREMNNKSQKT